MPFRDHTYQRLADPPIANRIRTGVPVWQYGKYGDAALLGDSSPSALSTWTVPSDVLICPRLYCTPVVSLQPHRRLTEVYGFAAESLRTVHVISSCGVWKPDPNP